MIILDGKKTSQEILDKVKEDISKLNVTPGLSIVLVGNDPASEIYVRNKIRTAEKIGIKATLNRLDETVTQKEVESLLDSLNKDVSVHGILLQLPIPKHLDSEYLIDYIDYNKDVDGFHTMNQGLLFKKRKGIRPGTPLGIMMLLEQYGIEIEGKEVVIVGRSQIVGMPLSKMFIDANATVTVAHSKTKNLSEVTKRADILVAAIGKANFITSDMVKEGAVVVDVGINRLDGKLVGDVDFNEVSKKASAITPVPGGVGPMTICALASNLYHLALKR